MTGKRPSLIAAAAVAGLIATGCGGAASAGSNGQSTSHDGVSTQSQAPPAGSLGTLGSVTTVDPGSTSQLKRYFAELAPVRREVQLANRAADHEASIASSGDYAALAADSRSVQLHLRRAVAAARRMEIPQGLERPHANLVRAFTVGGLMAGRLASLYDHIGPGSPAEYRHHVRPLEKLSLRLGNRWYAFMQGAMAAEDVQEPGWMGHLFDWT
jgi:hypothetical protein